MTEYELLPGHLYHHSGVGRFSCPCGTNEFRVEIGSNPLRFWCSDDCGAYYTEAIVDQLIAERLEVMVEDGQEGQ